MELLESVLRCLGRGLGWTEGTEEASVDTDTLELVESLLFLHPNDASEDAEDRTEGAVGEEGSRFGAPNVGSCLCL